MILISLTYLISMTYLKSILYLYKIAIHNEYNNKEKLEI